mgnify:CR=1 FL=1
MLSDIQFADGALKPRPYILGEQVADWGISPDHSDSLRQDNPELSIALQSLNEKDRRSTKLFARCIVEIYILGVDLGIHPEPCS